MSNTIDDNGSHPGTPTKAKRGLIMPGVRGLAAGYWGWQLIGRQTPDAEEAAAFGRMATSYSSLKFAEWYLAQERRAKSIEYRGVVSDSLGTIVWESEWIPRDGRLDPMEATRSVAVHHNITGCPVAGCEYGKGHVGVEGWS
jgi:hypothetical protein